MPYNLPFVFATNNNTIIQYLSLYFDNLAFDENSQTYNSKVYETATEIFSLNLTYDNYYYSVITADLVYNGTSYSGTKTGTENNVIFSRSLNVPLIASGTQQNNNFYWAVSLTNVTGTYMFNSTVKSQTVNQILLGECVAGSTYIKALNITAFDQVS